jgi:hypothetical protein
MAFSKLLVMPVLFAANFTQVVKYLMFAELLGNHLLALLSRDI